MHHNAISDIDTPVVAVDSHVDNAEGEVLIGSRRMVVAVEAAGDVGACFEGADTMDTGLLEVVMNHDRGTVEGEESNRMLTMFEGVEEVDRGSEIPAGVGRDFWEIVVDRTIVVDQRHMHSFELQSTEEVARVVVCRGWAVGPKHLSSWSRTRIAGVAKGVRMDTGCGLEAD